MALEKFDENSDDEIVAEINITPLTDIFLVLLIIFMITSSALIESGAKLNLPEVSKTESVSRNVVVTLTTDGEFYVNGVLTARESLRDELTEALQSSAQKVVILEGDKDAFLGDAVEIFQTAKEAGAEEVAIAAERSDDTDETLPKP
ncbi:MAG: ExbD/TolR family protein [Deltaproteobacteria bacterium]